MNQQRAQRRLWAWYLSALVYEWSYVQVANALAEDGTVAMAAAASRPPTRRRVGRRRDPTECMGCSLV